MTLNTKDDPRLFVTRSDGSGQQVPMALLSNEAFSQNFDFVLGAQFLASFIFQLTIIRLT